MQTILENAEELEVSDGEADWLEKLGLIYYCPLPDGGHFLDGTGCGLYHTHEDGFDRVDQALARIRTPIDSCPDCGGTLREPSTPSGPKAFTCSNSFHIPKTT